MRRTSFDQMNCSVAQSLEIVGEWWTLLIIRDALLGVTRFDDYQDRLGIARNVLTQRLDKLVEHGILVKQPYQEKPVRYDYLLTEKGGELWTVVTALRQWGDRWLAEAGEPVVTAHRGCGHVVTVEPSCSHCGQQLERRALTVRPGPGAHGSEIPPRTGRARPPVARGR